MEGAFGLGKRRYAESQQISHLANLCSRHCLLASSYIRLSPMKPANMLDLVKARLISTSLIWICASFFAMNLMTILRPPLFFLYFLLVHNNWRCLTDLLLTMKKTFILELNLRSRILRRVEYFILEKKVASVSVSTAINF